MEVEQNMPVDVKKEIIEKEEPVCDPNVGVKVEVEEKEEKMEVDEPSSAPLKEEEVDDADTGQISIKVEPKSEGLVKLIVDGIKDDENEETVVMTPDEIRSYLQLKISEYSQDPNVNPLLGVKKRILTQQEEIKDKSEEISKLSKGFDHMCRNQEKFLRHIGIFPQVQMSTVAVSVDLPVLPNAMPPISPAKYKGQDSLPKKEGTETKVASPSTPNTSIPKPTVADPTTPKPNISNPTSPRSTIPNPNSVLKSNVSTEAPKSAPKPSSGNIECIDLTDDTAPSPVKTSSTSNRLSTAASTAVSSFAALTMIRHPAPLPPKPFSATNNNLPNVPPKPRLKISAEERGIVLQWDMPPNKPPNTIYTKLSAFDIFGYQEQKNMVINTLLWKKIGTVKAMNLPMACTLTQFLEGNKYHFAVRAVDIYNRCGSYSDPISIVYKQSKPVQKT